MSADAHGQRSLHKNILTSWGAQLVQIASGFVVPRMLNHGLGQEALGVWDLVWSFAVYFDLLQMGVTSSINRYVAYHNAQQDTAGVNRVVSSVTVVMRTMSVAILLLSFGLAWGIGPLYGERLGTLLPVARWLVLLIGFGSALQVSSNVYSSILTGCHRWDLHNGIQAATSIIMLGGMVLALQLGYGLIGLAVANVSAEAIGRGARALLAYRLCPWLEIKWRHFNAGTAREMMAFGGKSFLVNVSQMLLNATTGLLITGYLGPASLALYNRPMALVRNLNVLLAKYSMVFSPTFSSLQAAGKHAEVRELMLRSLRYALLLALPQAILLLVFGDEVLRLWMGAAFVNHSLLITLQVGFLFQLVYAPLQRALAGLNMHGPIGWMSVTATVMSLSATAIALQFFGGGIETVAFTVATPIMLYGGVYMPLYACRKLGLSMSHFVKEVWAVPLACMVPYTAALLAARYLVFPGDGLKGLLLGIALGAVILPPVYWRFALGPRLKAAVLDRLPMAFRPHGLHHPSGPG